MKANSFIRLTMILSIMVFLSSCIFDGGNYITPSNNYITRNYKVTEFNKLNITTVGNVFYTQSKDGKTSVEIYGPDNIIDLIDASITDNTLVLSMQHKNKVRNVKKMKIMITTPELNGITFNGVGNVNIDEGLTTSILSVNQHGVGDVNINSLVCEEVTVSSTGVGNTKVNGTAKMASLSARGVGNIEAEDLEADKVTASSQGVGNISCYAKESIAASATGVGNIRYKGSPQDKQINKSGIGSIKQI